MAGTVLANNVPVRMRGYREKELEYLKTLERQNPITKGFLNKHESSHGVTPKLRSGIVDAVVAYLENCYDEIDFIQETLYLAVAIVDRFLELVKETTGKIDRWLLVDSAIFIAMKYTELFPLDITKFDNMLNDCSPHTEILEMEEVILKTLNYSLDRPLPLRFHQLYCEVTKPRPEYRKMTEYFLEQCLVHYEFCHHPPSLIAAAAMYLSFFICEADDKEIWMEKLVLYSSYKKEDLFPIVRDIAEAIVNAADDDEEFMAVREKYSSSKHMEICLRPELESPTMIALANML